MCQQFHWRGPAEDRGLAVGLYSAAYYLGGSLGGVLPSVFWDTGGWTLCVMLVLAVQAVTLGTALVAWRPVRVRTSKMDMHANVTQHVQDAGWLRAVDLVDHSPLSSTPWLDGWRSVFRAPMQALHDDRTTRRVDTFFETARRRASGCPVSGLSVAPDGVQRVALRSHQHPSRRLPPAGPSGTRSPHAAAARAAPTNGAGPPATGAASVRRTTIKCDSTEGDDA